MPTPRKPVARKAAYKAGEAPMREEQDRRIPLIVLALIAAIMVIVLVFTRCTGVEHEEGSDASASASAGSSESSAAIEVLAPENPSAKASLDAYSWEEIAQIAGKIADAASSDEALYVARQYNLVDADGKLDPSDTKTLVLDDGASLRVRILGFNQDAKSDGSGQAGITFMFADPVSSRAYNASGSNAGGWGASDLSYYLGVEFWALLPDELTSRISEVSKRFDSGNEESETSTTGDVMWLPSYVEVLGHGDGALSREGSQYQLFRDASSAASLPASYSSDQQTAQGGDAAQADASSQESEEASAASSISGGSWWLRSIDSGSDANAYYMVSDTQAATAPVETEYQVMPCFSM